MRALRSIARAWGEFTALPPWWLGWALLFLVNMFLVPMVVVLAATAEADDIGRGLLVTAMVIALVLVDLIALTVWLITRRR